MKDISVSSFCGVWVGTRHTLLSTMEKWSLCVIQTWSLWSYNINPNSSPSETSTTLKKKTKLFKLVEKHQLQSSCDLGSFPRLVDGDLDDNRKTGLWVFKIHQKLPKIIQTWESLHKSFHITELLTYCFRPDICKMMVRCWALWCFLALNPLKAPKIPQEQKWILVNTHCAVYIWPGENHQKGWNDLYQVKDMMQVVGIMQRWRGLPKSENMEKGERNWMEDSLMKVRSLYPSSWIAPWSMEKNRI